MYFSWTMGTTSENKRRKQFIRSRFSFLDITVKDLTFHSTETLTLSPEYSQKSSYNSINWASIQRISSYSALALVRT